MNDRPSTDARTDEQIGELLRSELPAPEHADGYRERVAALLTAEAVARASRRGRFPELFRPLRSLGRQGEALVSVPRPRRPRAGFRVAVFASLAVVLVVAVVVGSLEVLQHLREPDSIVRITDDTQVMPGTSVTTQTTLLPAGAGAWGELDVTAEGEAVQDLVVDPEDPAVLYAATARGLFKSTDGAANWTKLFPGFTYVVAVDPASPATVYAAVQEWEGLGTSQEVMVLLRSDDRGANWTVLDDAAQDIASAGVMGKPWMFLFDTSTSPSTVYYYGWGIRKSTDRGETWTTIIPDDTQFESVAIDGSRPGTIYAATPGEGTPGAVAEIRRSADGGSTWESLGLGVPGSSLGRLAVDPADGSVYWFVLAGEEGTYAYARSTDRWGSWTIIDGIESNEAKRACVVLNVRPGTPADVIDALVSPMSGLAAVGGYAPSEPFPWGAHVVTGGAESALYFFGQSGVYKSEDGGATWKQSNVGLGRAWVKSIVLGPQSSGDIYAATSVGILKSGDGGTTWSKIHEDTGSQLMVAPSRASVLYALTPDGLLRSSDGGTSWERRAFANMPADPGFISELYALALVDARDPDTLYAYNRDGTGDEALRRSTDGGDTWQPSPTAGATVLTALTSAPSDGSTLYAAATVTPSMDVYNNVEQATGLVVSNDGGTSWTYREAPDGIIGIAIDAGGPETVTVLAAEREPWTGMVLHPALYRSEDAGQSWQEIEVSVSGDVEWLAADPEAPGTLYVATTMPAGDARRTEVHFYRSTDKGASWEDLTGEWTLPRVQGGDMWTRWDFAAGLVADSASGFGLYALQQTQTSSAGQILPDWRLYAWAPRAR